MQSFEIAMPLHVSIGCEAGDVVLTTVDGTTAEVEVTPGHDDDASREAAENTVVELRRDGHELAVEVPKRSWKVFGREARVHIEIRMPHGADLSARTASADVTATGTYGAVHCSTASGDVTIGTAARADVKTASGDVRIDDVAGETNVKTSSGEVRVGHAGGPLHANVVSGDLRVGAVDDGASVGTVSGDIDLEAVARGDVEVKSVSGDVVVGVRSGVRVHLDASTMSGDLRSEIPLDEAPGDGEGPLVDIRGRTVSGDLRVRRVEAVAL